MPTKTDKPAEPEAAMTLEAQLEALRADVAALAASMASYGKVKMAGVQAAAEGLTEEATVRGRAAMREVRAERDKMEEKLQAQVKEKPLQTLLMAFGLGLVVSMIMRR